MPYEKLTRERILAAFALMGRYAAAEGVQLEIGLYGGTAMMLAFDARETTKDVDAIVRPADIGQRLAERVGREFELPADWLNASVRQFVSEKDRDGLIPLNTPKLEGIVLRRPSASYLLAMKAFACRTPLPGYAGDVDDLRFLCRKMNIRAIEEVERHLQRFYEHDVLTDRARAMLASILEPGKPARPD